MDAMKNTIAKGRDDWFESEEGKRSLAGEASGEYLKNCLEMAFLAGYHCAEISIHKYFSSKIRKAISESSKPLNDQ